MDWPYLVKGMFYASDILKAIERTMDDEKKDMEAREREGEPEDDPDEDSFPKPKT